MSNDCAREPINWVSDCCGAQMTTRGGDGSYGAPCWAGCLKCGSDCQETPVYDEFPASAEDVR